MFGRSAWARLITDSFYMPSVLFLLYSDIAIEAGYLCFLLASSILFPFSTVSLLFGIFLQNANTDNLNKYILYKVKTLLVPLYLWNLFYGIFVLFMHVLGFTYGEELTLQNLLIAPIHGGHQFYYNLGGWFVAPLFMVQICNVLVRRLLKDLHIRTNEWVFFYACLL